MDTRFAPTIGTSAQHAFACDLAQKAGYDSLRYTVADWSGKSVSKVQKMSVGKPEASQFIAWLQKKS